MTSSCHHSKFSTSFVLQKGVAPTNDDTQNLLMTVQMDARNENLIRWNMIKST